MLKIKDFYVCSFNFNGHGRGFAWGFNDEWLAYFVARRVLFGFADVLTDWQLECRYPSYFHNLISKTE